MKNTDSINMKTLRKTFAVAALTSAVAAGMQGCSSDNPDSGSSSATNNVSGIAVDGYLFGARVYVDLNNNGVRDAGEPSAITDKDGYFTTAKDGTDYCADTATVLEQKHCLKSFYEDGPVVIRTSGGFDLYTGEPFEGSLSAEVDATEGQAIENRMISPITSVLTGQSDANKALILGNLGITASDVDRDFLDPSEFDAATVNAAIGLHKATTIIADSLKENYDEIGENDGVDDTSNSIIYDELATILQATGALDNAALDDVLERAESRVRTLYTEQGLSLPALVGSSERSQVAANGENVQNLVDAVLNPTAAANPVVDSDNVDSRVLAVELLTRKVTDGESDAEILDVIAAAEDVDSTLYSSLLDAGSEIDFDGLANTDISSSGNYSDLDISGATPFFTEGVDSLNGKQLSASYSDDDVSISGDATFFFAAEDDSATQGNLSLCLRYNDSDEDLDEETAGAVFEGEWSAISDKRLLITLAGGYKVTLVSTGQDGLSDVYSLYYAEDTVSWNSATGLISSGDEGAVTLPADDAACEAMFQQQQF